MSRSAERPVIRLDADEHNVVHAIWGRSGRRAVLTIAGPAFEGGRQCTLTPEQAAELGRFLAARPDG